MSREHAPTRGVVGHGPSESDRRRRRGCSQRPVAAVPFPGLGGFAEGWPADALRDLDEAVDAHARDLVQLGAWGRATIVVLSEFGRRNAENGSGTDHGDGGLMLVIGGAVRGGMYGPDLTAQHLAGPTLPPLVDFRSVYEELLAGHFGVEPAPVFDEPYARTPLGLFA